jgi:hypothetical protein
MPGAWCGAIRQGGGGWAAGRCACRVSAASTPVALRNAPGASTATCARGVAGPAVERRAARCRGAAGARILSDSLDPCCASRSAGLPFLIRPYDGLLLRSRVRVVGLARLDPRWEVGEVLAVPVSLSCCHIEKQEGAQGAFRHAPRPAQLPHGRCSREHRRALLATKTPLLAELGQTLHLQGWRHNRGRSSGPCTAAMPRISSIGSGSRVLQRTSGLLADEMTPEPTLSPEACIETRARRNTAKSLTTVCTGSPPAPRGHEGPTPVGRCTRPPIAVAVRGPSQHAGAKASEPVGAANMTFSKTHDCSARDRLVRHRFSCSVTSCASGRIVRQDPSRRELHFSIPRRVCAESQI